MTQATVVQPASQAKTCLICPHFNDFHEPNERGWCELFNRTARTYHLITPDCITSSNLLVSKEEKEPSNFITADFSEAFPTEELVDEADLPYSEYEVGSVVKVIDAEEDYTKWGVFEIVECRYNSHLYRSSESYLNEVAWYYRLSSHSDSTSLDKTLWVAENEICDFYQAHLICTCEVF